jgi:hypothetical protein
MTKPNPFPPSDVDGLDAIAFLRALRNRDTAAMNALAPTPQDKRALTLLLAGFLDQAVEYLAAWNEVTAEELLDDWQTSAVRRSFGLEDR